MHEQCVKIFKAYTHETVLYLTINTRKQKQIRQKQSLVHKVPSGVAILSHVRDVAAIVHPQNINNGGWGDIYLVNVGRQGIRCLLAVKNGVGVAT
jgi:hypothetical protein